MGIFLFQDFRFPLFRRKRESTHSLKRRDSHFHGLTQGLLANVLGSKKNEDNRMSTPSQTAYEMGLAKNAANFVALTPLTSVSYTHLDVYKRQPDTPSAMAST